MYKFRNQVLWIQRVMMNIIFFFAKIQVLKHVNRFIDNVHSMYYIVQLDSCIIL